MRICSHISINHLVNFAVHTVEAIGQTRHCLSTGPFTRQVGRSTHKKLMEYRGYNQTTFKQSPQRRTGAFRTKSCKQHGHRLVATS